VRRRIHVGRRIHVLGHWLFDIVRRRIHVRRRINLRGRTRALAFQNVRRRIHVRIHVRRRIHVLGHWLLRMSACVVIGNTLGLGTNSIENKFTGF
jgi:hypothetical protein